MAIPVETIADNKHFEYKGDIHATRIIGENIIITL